MSTTALPVLLKRLYISFAISIANQSMYAPRLPHWKVVHRIVKHLKAHPRCGLFQCASGHLLVENITPSDYAGGLPDRKSTNEIVYSLVKILSREIARSKLLL